MGLIIVPTPIGNAEDFGLRAQKVLQNSKTIIVEEFKESSYWLRQIQASGKKLERLNEHSTPEDLQFLANLCLNEDVALITDCGTPGFCDPGADLVKICREKKIKVQALPGPSSLMTLLSLSSQRLDQFVFRGFLPAENESRIQAWKEIAREEKAIVLMDTPYRMNKMLSELEVYFTNRKCLFAANLTQESECILDGYPKFIQQSLAIDFPELKKAEFMLLVYPSKLSINTKK